MGILIRLTCSQKNKWIKRGHTRQCFRSFTKNCLPRNEHISLRFHSQLQYYCGLLCRRSLARHAGKTAWRASCVEGYDCCNAATFFVCLAWGVTLRNVSYSLSRNDATKLQKTLPSVTSPVTSSFPSHVYLLKISWTRFSSWETDRADK